MEIIANGGEVVNRTLVLSMGKKREKGVEKGEKLC
jgi:hypothetical protein